MPPPDNDTTHRELASMDRFLDSHPETAEQLRKDPSLINNQEFLENHPGLKNYLQQHPGVREEFSENPNGFMRRENRYDLREGDPTDTTRRQLASMDRFLDSHPETAEQLRKDPSLINNKAWVANHPGLQAYLQQHPGVREEFSENPNGFMQKENRYDLREGDPTDTTRRQLASMDRFLDSHPEAAEQLRKDPSLINNKAWVANHPGLQAYLQQHPGVREEITEDPNAFMRQEERYDRQEQRFGDDPEGRRELTSFGQFLGGHSSVAAELSGNPSLANKKEYLATHPELGQYLKAHPAMSQQLTANPQAVMSSNWVTQGSGMATKASSPPKPKSAPNQ